MTEGDYIDLSLNPERFTGYAGPSAARVWRSIYEENCFGLSEISLMSGNSPAPVSLPDTMMNILQDDGGEGTGECLEKRVYYKVISGVSQVVVVQSSHSNRIYRTSCIHIYPYLL